jgi:DNA-binding IscR family transcriptional regulator
VISPFQDLAASSMCLLKNQSCDHRRPCGAHERWVRMAEPVFDFFWQTTVADMIESEATVAS